MFSVGGEGWFNHRLELQYSCGRMKTLLLPNDCQRNGSAGGFNQSFDGIYIMLLNKINVQLAVA